MSRVARPPDVAEGLEAVVTPNEMAFLFLRDPALAVVLDEFEEILGNSLSLS